MIIQLTIGQHEFELRGSTYIQIKKKKYYSFVPSWLVGFVYREESAKGLIVKVNPWPQVLRSFSQRQ